MWKSVLIIITSSSKAPQKEIKNGRYIYLCIFSLMYRKRLRYLTGKKENSIQNGLLGLKYLLA